VGDGLDVVDQGRAAVDAALERAWRVRVGVAGPPLSQCTSAVSSPAT
jgi:hypothetical protein